MLKVKQAIFLIALGLLSGFSFAQNPMTVKQPVEIITNKEKIVVAIEPFFDPKMNQVIINNLNLLGNIQVVESNHAKNYRYLVTNQTMQQGDILIIRFAILDKVTNQIINGIQTVNTKNTPQTIRMAGHKISDRIDELIMNDQNKLN